MENVVSGAALGAITGLTFIAYQHPQAFERIGTTLLLIGVVSLAALISWEWAIAETYSAMVGGMSPTDRAAALAAVDEIRLPAWAVLGIGAAASYVAILLALPGLLAIPRQSGADETLRAQQRQA